MDWATLNEPEQQKQLEIRGQSAEHRAGREEREAGEKEGLAAQLLCQEARRRDNDGVGDQVGGHHPGCFVLADAHTAGDIAQCDIGDGGVEDFHE
jgi:hypothetical protein